ncbi:MAG: hypothetical protein LBL96_02440 [Clostridiales bacterium]|jgi:hypothetical protein|nr:hypothetical protein [Clostridiales bacterium]
MTQASIVGGNFLTYYISEIMPRIQSLDITLKSMDEPITMPEAAIALCITLDELRHIMSELGIVTIDKRAMLKLMRYASSPICTMYQRELECGSPFVYTRENIAYIYGLPLDAVNKACDELGMVELTSLTMPELFSALHFA